MDILETLDILKRISREKGETIVIRGDHVFSIARDSKQGNMLATLDEMRTSVARIMAWMRELEKSP